MSPGSQIAVFGGSFDPPHIGHVKAAEHVLGTGEFERLLAIPTYAHAFDKPLSPFEHRLAMTRLAMSDLEAVTVSAIEQTLPTPSRTLATLERLGSEHPRWSLRLVVGADVLLEKDQWLGFERISELAPLFVLGRAGVALIEAPPAVLPDVSSTRVRALLRHADGRRADHPELLRLVPRPVLEYIDTHELYR